MSKAKKTRKDKERADLRRKLQFENRVTLPTVSETLSSQENNRISISAIRPSAKPKQDTIALSPHLISDVKKTAILTGAIILGEYLLYTLLKQHVVPLPFVQY